MITPEVRHDNLRGCGYRKPGGIYLIGPPLGASCCKLPHPLDICPCCGQGIKPSRSWTWIDPGALFGDKPCTDPSTKMIAEDYLQIGKKCPLEFPEKLGRAGLLWIGAEFYPTPADFLKEAAKMGISRRIPHVPRDFKLGETWVLLAHQAGIVTKEPVLELVDEELVDTGKTISIEKSAIFSVFRPSALEYVTKGNETQDELEHIIKRGLLPVKVEFKRKAC